MMRRSWILFVLLLIASPASAALYFASPNGGAAAGCGDNTTNVCTLARAHTVASAGDMIQAACGTYDLGSSSLAITKNVIIYPVSPGCAIITTSNSTSTIELTASNDINLLRFGAFDLRNTGGAGQILRINTAAYDATVEIDGTIIPNGGTNRHIVDAWVRGTVKIINPVLSGTIGAQAAIYSVTTPTSPKKISVTGMTGALTASASSTPGILIERAAGVTVTEWAYVARNNFSITVPSGLGTNALGIGIRMNRVTIAPGLTGLNEPPIVEQNTVVLTTLSATGVDALGILTGSTDSTAVADGTVIRDNDVTCNGPATRCITIGTDGTTAFFAANVEIYRNIVRSSFYNGSATPHGITINRVTGGTAWGNTVIGFAVCLLTSRNEGAIVSGNLCIGSYYAPLFSKGSGTTTPPVFSNNTVIMDDTIAGVKFGNYGCQSVATQSVNNAATSFRNQICYVKSGTGWKYVVVDASQVASFDRSNYFSIPTLTTPWSYQGSTFASLALWNAAATVGTELNVDPLFVSATDYRLQETSPLREAGILAAGGCRHFLGYPCSTVPDVGAYRAFYRRPL